MIHLEPLVCYTKTNFVCEGRKEQTTFKWRKDSITQVKNGMIKNSAATTTVAEEERKGGGERTLKNLR